MHFSFCTFPAHDSEDGDGLAIVTSTIRITTHYNRQLAV